MKADFEIIKAFMKDTENIEAIWYSKALVWIDWREYEEDIIHYFNKKMEDKIAFELIDNQKDYGDDIVLIKNDKRLQIPYGEIMQRDVTIKYFNDFIQPQYQIRWFVESFGNDTLAFVLLSSDEWNALKAEFGANEIKYYFSEINLESAMFDFEIKMEDFDAFSTLRQKNKGIDFAVFQKITSYKNELRQLSAKRNASELNLKEFYAQKKSVQEKLADLMMKYQIIE